MKERTRHSIRSCARHRSRVAGESEVPRTCVSHRNLRPQLLSVGFMKMMIVNLNKLPLLPRPNTVLHRRWHRQIICSDDGSSSTNTRPTTSSHQREINIRLLLQVRAHNDGRHRALCCTPISDSQQPLPSTTTSTRATRRLQITFHSTRRHRFIAVLLPAIRIIRPYDSRRA